MIKEIAKALVIVYKNKQMYVVSNRVAYSGNENCKNIQLYENVVKEYKSKLQGRILKCKQ